MDLASQMGTFKGIMLCNRPQPSGPSGVDRGGSNSGAGGAIGGVNGDGGRAAFISTVMPEDQLGLNPVHKARVAAPLKDKNKADDVTWRHKKWLAEFQIRKNEIADLMEDKTQEISEAKARFAERAAMQREAIRMARDINPDDDQLLAEAMKGYIHEETAQQAAQRLAEQTAQFQQTQSDKPQKLTEKAVQNHNKTKKAKLSKPKWALTANENEEVEDLEVDDLLDFAENLDYEQYIDDMEVKEALSFVKKRVVDLENGAPKEVDPDAMEEGEGDEGDELGETKGIPRARAKWMKKNEDWEKGSTTSNMSAGSNVSEKSILEDGRMKGVHSAASVRAMMEKTKAAMAPNLAVKEPIIATAPSRTSNPADPSNLPYLYRHPAV